MNIKSNIKHLIKETKTDLDMLERIGFKKTHIAYKQTAMSLKRLNDLKAELREKADFWDNRDKHGFLGGYVLAFNEVLGDV